MTEPPINIHIHSTLSCRQRAQLRKALYKEEPTVSVVPVKSAPAKPGWQTTEFWVSVLTVIGGVAAAQQNAVPDRYAAYLAMASTIAYALSRGIAKH